MTRSLKNLPCFSCGSSYIELVRVYGPGQVDFLSTKRGHKLIRLMADRMRVTVRVAENLLRHVERKEGPRTTPVDVSGLIHYAENRGLTLPYCVEEAESDCLYW